MGLRIRLPSNPGCEACPLKAGSAKKLDLGPNPCAPCAIYLRFERPSPRSILGRRRLWQNAAALTRETGQAVPFTCRRQLGQCEGCPERMSEEVVGTKAPAAFRMPEGRKGRSRGSRKNPRLVQSLGVRLGMFRKRKGLTQGEVARAIGSDLCSVSRWERGERTPGAEVLARLALVFPDLDLPWLLLGNEASARKKAAAKDDLPAWRP